MLNSANKLKLLTVFIAITLLIGGCTDTEKKKTSHFDKGMEYVKQEELGSAILEFKNAIQVDPKYAAARYQLGLALFNDGQLKKGARELKIAADLDPQNLDAQFKIGRIYLLLRQFDKSRERALKILEIDPKHVEGLLLLADLQTLEGQIPEAIEIVDKALAIEPENIELLVTKAYYHAELRNYTEAENILLQTIELSPETISTYWYLGQLYALLQMQDKEEDLIRKTIKRFPGSPTPYIQLVNLKLRQGEFEEAEIILKQAIAMQPKGFQGGNFEVFLGNFYKKLGRFGDAESAYQQALIKSSNPIGLKASLADFYVEQGNVPAAEKELTAVFAEDESHHIGNLVKAKILIIKGKNTDALEILDNLLESYPQFGQAYIHKSFAHLRRGDLDLSLKAANEAVKYLPRNSRAHTLLAQLYFMKQDCPAAKQEALTAGMLEPDNFRAAIISGQCFLDEKEYDKALKLFAGLNERVPNNVEVMHYMALTHFARNEISEAQSICQKILTDNPEFSRSLQLLVDIALRDGKVNEAVYIVEKQLEKSPENIDYNLLLGRLYIETGQFNKALVVIKKAQELDPKALQSYTMIAGTYASLGKTDEAIDELQKLLDINPSLVTTHMAIASILELKGDKDNARKHYLEALKLEPEFAAAANNLAWIIADEEDGDLGEALRLALIAKEQFPVDPSIADTLGWIHYKRQSYSLALTQFIQAARGLPDNLTVQYHLALALKANKRNDEAREILSQITDSDSDYPKKAEAERLLQEWE